MSFLTVLSPREARGGSAVLKFKSLVIVAVSAMGLRILGRSTDLIAGAAAPTPPRITPSDLEQAMRELQNATIGLQTAQIVLGATAVILTLAAILAAVVTVTIAREWIRNQARETAGREIGKVTGRIYSALSYIEWERANREKADLSLAIQLGERALEASAEAFDEESVLVAESNLAYYYAQKGLPEKKEVALEYARLVRDAYPKYQRKTFLANHIYVRMRYAADCDAQTLEPIKREAEDLRERIPALADEMEEYIEEMKTKCPALA
jgi:hypothetical protein